jgi:hypothetical protein
MRKPGATGAQQVAFRGASSLDMRYAFFAPVAPIMFIILIMPGMSMSNDFIISLQKGIIFSGFLPNPWQKEGITVFMNTVFFSSVSLSNSSFNSLAVAIVSSFGV